jgi:DNA end-binding protein Ku
VNAKVNDLPIPQDEVPAARPNNVINLMDALRKSIGGDTETAAAPKKPSASEKAPAAKKGMGIVKEPARTAKRKSA